MRQHATLLPEKLPTARLFAKSLQIITRQHVAASSLTNPRQRDRDSNRIRHADPPGRGTRTARMNCWFGNDLRGHRASFRCAKAKSGSSASPAAWRGFDGWCQPPKWLRTRCSRRELSKSRICDKTTGCRSRLQLIGEPHVASGGSSRCFAFRVPLQKSTPRRNSASSLAGSRNSHLDCVVLTELRGIHGM